MRYFWIIRLTFLKLMAYRMRYITGIATYAVFVGGQYAIWRAVFAAKHLAPNERLEGLTLPELTTYLAVGYIARSAYFTNTDSEIASRFQSGDVVLDLLKPVDFHAQWMAQAFGETCFRILFFAAPMSMVLFPLFSVQLPTAVDFLQFVTLFLLAFVINAELNLLAGTMSFFLEDITGLMSLKRNLIMLLSGLMVPLHFFPAWLAKLTMLLPFSLVSYYPTMAYVGRLGSDGTKSFATIVCFAFGWWAILRLMNVIGWARARASLEAQGG
jgi:ABC-2 type transport system permease protein